MTADFFQTQVLTSHGSFRVIVNRIGKQTDLCLYCGITDSMAHTLFDSVRWGEERYQMLLAIGITLTTNNLGEILMKSKKDWEMVHSFVRKVMKIKQDYGRH